MGARERTIQVQFGSEGLKQLKRVLCWLVYVAVCLLPATALAQIPSEVDNCPQAVVDMIKSVVASDGLDGVTYAVAPNRRLTCAGAYGYADKANLRAMTPNTTMRIGSLSKVITGMAIAKLWEDGMLSPDDPVLNYVSDLLPPGGPADDRWRKVTLRMLLQHSTGWDRAVGGEPMQNSIAISKSLGIRGPATITDITRWVFTQPLAFDPGTKDSYTGFEYGLLGLIVERVAKTEYEQYVRQNILQPLGIRTSMRVGRTLPEGRAFADVPAYYEAVYSLGTPDPGVKSVFPYITGKVPSPYGTWYQEALGPSGGWTATAPALLRFANGIFGRGGKAFFKPETIAEISARPAYLPASANQWYGFGWVFVQAPAGLRIQYSGLLLGSHAQIFLFENGNSYAFIDNKYGGDAGTIESAFLQTVSPLNISGPDLFGTPKYTDGPATGPEIRAVKGVVQGASFEPGVTGGSWFTVFGWNLSKTTRLWGDGDFADGKLPTMLDGVEIKVNGEPASIYYISPGQINAQLPNLSVTGTATLQVVVNGVASQPEPIEIRASSPEFIRYSAGGKSFVVAIHTDGTLVADPALVPGLRAAAAGETIEIYGIGFASSPAGVIINQVVPVSNTVVNVGTQTADVSFSGLVAAGLFQANVKIPDLPPGDYTVGLTVNGVSSLVTGIVPVR